jgi:hypothetical protein
MLRPRMPLAIGQSSTGRRLAGRQLRLFGDALPELLGEPSGSRITLQLSRKGTI